MASAVGGSHRGGAHANGENQNVPSIWVDGFECGIFCVGGVGNLSPNARDAVVKKRENEDFVMQMYTYHLEQAIRKTSVNDVSCFIYSCNNPLRQQ